MYLVVGLGNIGEKYEHTRHNVGFDVLDLCAEKYNFKFDRIKFKGEYGETLIGGEKVLFLKPHTYMNLSGESVREIVNFYKIPLENIIIIYDDISLECGRLRIKTKGSAGGHNGIKNIILNLSTDVFARIKVGVGQPQNDLISFVLGKFSSEDKRLVEDCFRVAVEAVEVMITKGNTEAMNRFNGYKGCS